MSYFKEKYTPAKLEQMQRYLETQAANNDPRYFEIFVDNLKVVPRTNDITRFEQYQEYISSGTELIRLKLYSTHPTSPKNECFDYFLNEPKAKEEKQEQGLNGVDIKQHISDSILRERERWDAEQLRKELDENKKQLREAEEYIDKQETIIKEKEEEIQKFKAKKLHWGDVNLGELASVVVEGFVRRNPQILAQIPGGEGLAGIIEKDNERIKNTSDTPAAEVSFSKKNENTSEADQGYIQLLKQLETCFSQSELDCVMQILSTLAQQPQHLPTIAELLNLTPPQP